MNDVISLQQARQQIMDCMYWYCRAFDRLDQDVLRKVFHPSATLHYPFIEGPWRQVVDWLWGTFAAYDAHSLQISQVMIDFSEDGSTATSECYVTAIFWQGGGAAIDTVLPGHTESVSAATGRNVTPGTQSIACARYLDRWSLADGRWAVDDRRALVDFYSSCEGTGWLGDGRRDREDPSYTLPAFATPPEDQGGEQ